jgi:hypothetical protein
VTDVDWSRTNSRGGRGSRRGQTLHDYVAGITIFIVTVALVVGLLPNIVAPFQSGENAAESQALRVGDQVVANLSLAGAPNTLEAANISEFMATDERGLIRRYGLPDHAHINVTLTTLNGSRIVANGSGVPQTAGATAVGESAAASARIVDVSGDGTDCSPACRLLVRVW